MLFALFWGGSPGKQGSKTDEQNEQSSDSFERGAYGKELVPWHVCEKEEAGWSHGDWF